MAGSDVTHSVYRSTAYVTRMCAQVTDAAAVAVSLNSRYIATTWQVIRENTQKNTETGNVFASYMSYFGIDIGLKLTPAWPSDCLS